MQTDIAQPVNPTSTHTPTSNREFKSIEEYLRHLEPEIIVDVQFLGIENEEQFIQYLQCVETYIEHSNKHSNRILIRYEDMKKVVDRGTYYLYLDGLLESLEYPFFYGDHIKMENPAIKLDKRLDEINYCIMIIRLEEIKRIQPNISPAVYNYLIKACQIVDERNAESILGWQRESRAEYHMETYKDEDDDHRQFIRDYAKACTLVNRTAGTFKKYTEAKKPKRFKNDYEQTLVECAEAILSFSPSSMESFVDPCIARFTESNAEHPEELIDYFFNVNYAVTYDYGAASLHDLYVEDVQQHEQEGMYHFYLTEMAEYHPNQVKVDPEREDKIHAAYRYFVAFDTIYELIKPIDDAKHSKSKQTRSHSDVISEWRSRFQRH